jgi:hypothetical protein
VVSQAIRSAAGQVAAWVMCQVARHATPHITRHIILSAIPLVIQDITCPVVPHIIFSIEPSDGTCLRQSTPNPAPW